MKSFLQELAARVHRTYPRLDALTIIFPNRRAVLYFRKHLSTLLSKPVFAPRLATIEDFISGMSILKVPDKLELVHRLHEAYRRVVGLEEPLDKFYFWGEMLLRDFDEADKYMVNADHLFKDLSHQKELDSSFDFLTEEQQEFLKSFWGSFDENMTENKRRFLRVWKELPKVYHAFREDLQAAGLAYEGMLHRMVADQLASGAIQSPYPAAEDPLLIFAGFNALTKAEEIVLSHFVEKGSATISWDIDAYYVNNNTQEAGRFFREYQDHRVLGKTFPQDVPANFLKKQQVHVLGASQPVGQTKLMAQVLHNILIQGADPEETLIVLPDEKLLLPVLHGIGTSVEKLNVTMGFPLSSTPLFNLIELLAELQINVRREHFNHRQVLAILGHPYGVAADAALSQSKRKEILQHNWISIPGEWLRSGPPLYQQIFKPVEVAGMIDYLRSIIITIGSLHTIEDFDKEYAYHFVKFLNRMEEVFGEAAVSVDDKTRKADLKSFLRLFRQLVRSQKIPFTGEPLRGLQVMGVLETRNLDYRNVFILSLNEGSFPSFGSSGSYIPYNIRKAYNLPTVEHQDSIYAYLFYRTLQRAENVYLFYNSETDDLGQGEMSRYLQQLLFESGLKIEKNILHNPINPRTVEPIVVPKDDRVFDKLARYCIGQRQPKELSPTALNDYIECRLKFYFKYVAHIREAQEVEEDLDARVLGNFLHKVMELFYEQTIRAKESNIIEASDLEGYEQKISAILDRVFIEAYKLDPGKPVTYEGQRLVVSEVVKSFVDRILAMDKMHAPFKMEAIEKRGLTYTLPLQAEGDPVVVLGGAIDRADSKDNLLRIIDYKTGKDKTDIRTNVSDLFVRNSDRNKAAFQTILYALLYKANANTAGMRIVPGLINRVNLFDEDFRFGLKIGKDYINDITPLLPEFEKALKEVLEELYNPEVPFDQTLNLDICKICPYQGICYR